MDEAPPSTGELQIRDIIKMNLERAIDALGKWKKEGIDLDVEQKREQFLGIIAAKLEIDKEEIGDVEDAMKDASGTYTAVIFNKGESEGITVSMQNNRIIHFSKTEKKPIQIKSILEDFKAP